MKSKLNWRWLATGFFAVVVGCAAVKQIGDSMGGRVGGMISGASTFAESYTIDAKKEDDFGRSVAIDITNEYQLSNNKQLLVYVNYIGLTLADSMNKQHPQFAFGVLDTDRIGAFSGPRGYVFITRGAITAAQDEAEIAGILGHEMTHVMNNDGINAIKLQMQKSGATQAVVSATKVGGVLPYINSGTDMIVHKGYDQPQEFAADQGAVHLLVAAGYDPNSFLHYLQRLDAQQSSGNGGGIMSTHPGTHERVGKVAAEISSTGATGGVTLKDRFHNTVFPGVAIDASLHAPDGLDRSTVQDR